MEKFSASIRFGVYDQLFTGCTFNVEAHVSLLNYDLYLSVASEIFNQKTSGPRSTRQHLRMVYQA